MNGRCGSLFLVSLERGASEAREIVHSYLRASSAPQVNGEYMDATTTAEATHWVVYHHETSTATPSTGLIVGAVIGGLVMTTALVVLAYRWRSKQPGYLPLN